MGHSIAMYLYGKRSNFWRNMQPTKNHKGRLTNRLNMYSRGNDESQWGKPASGPGILGTSLTEPTKKPGVSIDMAEQQQDSWKLYPKFIMYSTSARKAGT